MNSNLATANTLPLTSAPAEAEEYQEEDLVLYPPDRSEYIVFPMDELARRDRIRMWVAYHTDSRHMMMYGAAVMIYGALFCLWLFAQQL